MEQITTEQQIVLRFDAKTELGVLKALSNFSKYAEDSLTEEECIKQAMPGFIDPANICLISAKTQEAKRIIYKFIEKTFNKGDSIKRIEENYLKNDGSQYHGGLYSAEYTLKIFKLLSIFEELPIKIYSSKEYPAIFENKHFQIILAPRIQEEV